MELELNHLIILILSALVTSSISAVLGMGGGIILLGIMAIIIPEGYMVIALHGMIQLFSNTTRTLIFRNHIKKYHKRLFFRRPNWSECFWSNSFFVGSILRCRLCSGY